MKATHLIYFCKGIESVFDSQVLELIKSVEKRGLFQKVILAVGIKNEKELLELKKREIPEEIGIITYKPCPNYPVFSPLIRRRLSAVIKKHKMDFEEAFIHVRGEILAWHLASVLKPEARMRILPDIRGAGVEELRENKEFRRFQKYLKLWNNNNALKYLRNFRRVTAVSPALKNYLTDNYKLSAGKIAVTPDLAGKSFIYDESLRSLMRKRLNLSDEDILVIFSNGSTGKWQNWQNNEILNTIAGKGVKVLNLSRFRVEHPNITNMFIQYSEVPSFLNAADAAVIWSDRRIVSQVRSPVKFSEYICCGLPIIANDSVDMITGYIKKTSYGVLLSGLDEFTPAMLCALRSLERQEISAYGQRWLGIEKITDEYLQIYSSF